eukprot:2480091-Pyramimonas_sp.AAC.1
MVTDTTQEQLTRFVQPRDRLMSFTEYPRGGGRKCPVYAGLRSGPLVPTCRSVRGKVSELAENLFPDPIPSPTRSPRPHLRVGD